MAENMTIGVFGYFGVGKTSITVQYVNKVFLLDHDPTIEEYFETSKNVDGKMTKLTILDTAGQEQYSSLLTDTMSSAEAFVLVYSVTDAESFTKLADLENKVKIVKESMKEVPMILVGNKIDLPRVIKQEQGQEMATKFGCPYIETSAKTRQNIDEAFEIIVREVRRIRNAGGNKTKTDTKKKKGCKHQ
jgi:small GTP-binding protein